jgi:hypothetical protein
MQDRVCDEPMHREEEGTPSSGRFWHRLWLMGISPWQMDVDHDGQDATSDAGRFPGHVAALLRLVWHVWHDAGGPGGATFHSFGVYHALRGPTSPLRGLKVTNDLKLNC